MPTLRIVRLLPFVAAAFMACNGDEPSGPTPGDAGVHPDADIPPDTEAPNTTLTAVPVPLTNVAAASFEFEASESESTFEGRLDGATWVAVQSPHAITNLSDGAHTFDVRAVDAAKNVDASPATHTWTVDTQEPDTTIDAAPTGSVNSRTATITVSSNDTSATFRAALDGGTFSDVASTFTFEGLADGAHTVSVVALDPAGNEDPSPATHTWTVDTQAPDTTIDSAPTGSVNSATATVTVSSNEPGATFRAAVDGGNFSDVNASFTLQNLAEGAHTVSVVATDAAGNEDPSPAEASWTVDTAGPDTEFSRTPPPVSVSADATFEFFSDESNATFEARLDGGTFAVVTSPADLSSLPAGQHIYEVRALDAAGNPDLTPASYTWMVSLPSGVIDVLFPPPNSVTETDTLIVRGTSNQVLDALRVDGVAATSGDNFLTWQAEITLSPGDNFVFVDFDDGGVTTSGAAIVFVRYSPLGVIGFAAGLDLDAANSRVWVVDNGRDLLFSFSTTDWAGTIVSGPSVGTGTTFITPASVRFDADQNRVLVHDAGTSRTFSVNLTTGDRTIISDNNNTGPFNGGGEGISLDATNQLLYYASIGSDLLAVVDLGTGDRTIVSDSATGMGPDFGFPSGVALDATNGRLFVLDVGPSSQDGLLSVDLATGDRTLLSQDGVIGTGTHLSNPGRLAFDSTGGRVFGTDDGGRRIYEIDLTSGDRRTVSQSGNRPVGQGPDFSPQDVAWDGTNSRALVADSRGGLISVNPSNGNRSLLAGGLNGDGEILGPVLLVYDSNGGRLLHHSNSLYGIDITSGNRTEVAGFFVGAGPSMQGVLGVAIDAANNRALGVDDLTDSLLTIALDTGDRVVVSDGTTGTGTTFGNPASVVYDAANNRALVLDWDLNAVLAVDLTNGNRTIISDDSTGTGAPFVFPTGFAFDSGRGRLLVTESSQNRVIAVDLANGNRTVFSANGTGTGPSLGSARAIVIDTLRDRAVVANHSDDLLVAVNLTTGDRTTISSNTLGNGPPLDFDGGGPATNVFNMLDYDPDHDRFYVLSLGLRACLAVDAETGDRVVLAK